MERSGRNPWQPVANGKAPKPDGKKGVTSLVPQREVESREPEGPQYSARNLAVGPCSAPTVFVLYYRFRTGAF
jgi:hypothetical protein